MADTTSLVKNTDFAAELLLNKVMNGQYRTENGKTLTMAGRINASKLDSTANTFNVQAENVAKGSTIADATQDALTEVLNLAKSLQNSAASITDSEALKTMAAAYKSELAKLTATEVDGFAVLGGTTGVDMGLESGELDVGVDVTGLGGYSDLSGAISNMESGTAVTASSLDAIVSNLYAAVAAAGTKASVLGNRYDTLNDMASSYKNASDSQVVTAGGSPTSLLNSLL
ncbi:MAG: hypothetical protein K5657_03555 [Desulfovibrio sp.]|nr:hypothetical protein [Desulfovibrio sp.]